MSYEKLQKKQAYSIFLLLSAFSAWFVYQSVILSVACLDDVFQVSRFKSCVPWGKVETANKFSHPTRTQNTAPPLSLRLSLSLSLCRSVSLFKTKPACKHD
jgi:hypothetical protein